MTLFNEMTTDTTRECKCCGRVLPIDKFSINPRYRGMRASTCTECVTSKKKAAYAETARRQAERKARAEERERRKAERAKQLRAIFEIERRGDTGLASYTTWDLIQELSKRGRLYDALATDCRDMIRL